MNRTQGLHAVRLPGFSWFLSLVGVALLAFVAGMGVDNLRRRVPAQAEAQPAPAAAHARRGVGTGSVYDGNAPHTAVAGPSSGVGTNSVYDGRAPRASKSEFPRGFTDYLSLNQAAAAAQRDQTTDEHDRHGAERHANPAANAERSWLPPQVAEELDRQQAAKPKYSTPPYGMTDHLPTRP